MSKYLIPNEKQYWAVYGKELWNKWKNEPKEKILKALFDYLLDLTGDAEAYTLIEACKKQLGLEFYLPNAFSKSDMVSFGYPETEWEEAKV